MLDKLKQLEAENIVACQRHPAAPLTIWNYTARCQYQRAWGPETLAARGLILDDAGQVVARGFLKFFNLQEHTGPLPDEPFRVFDKLDGSLGILYLNPITGLYNIATRGSFVSEQAIRGSMIFHARYGSYRPPDGTTAVFEIIYPENRIVVDYGQTADLFHLGLVSNTTGLPLPVLDQDWPGPFVASFDSIPPHELLKLAKPNCEGFVVRYQSGFQIKVKLAEYVRIHRIMFQTSTRSIWEHLLAGGSLDGILAEAPDEVFPFIREHGERLLANYAKMEQNAWTKFHAICGLAMESRKAFAEAATRNGGEGILPALMFAMLDHKDYRSIIWKALEPKWVPAKVAPTEDVA